MMKKPCEACGTVIRVKEPSTLGTAKRDPLVDIAYEVIKSGTGGWPRQQAERRIQMAGGMQHVEAMRAAVRL